MEAYLKTAGEEPFVVQVMCNERQGKAFAKRDLKINEKAEE